MYITLGNKGFSTANQSSLLQANSLNILVVGLGGLGVVSLTQKIRNLLAGRYGQVHTSEQRGVAQRRASTSALIKAADSFVSPALSNASIDVMIALEPLEALRYSHLLKADGQCFLSDLRIETIGGCQGQFSYPDTGKIVEAITAYGASCLVLSVANWLKAEAMLSVYASSALLGCFCAAFGFDYRDSYGDKVQTSSHRKNQQAFEWGCRQYIQQGQRYNHIPKAASTVVFDNLPAVFAQ